MNMRELEELPKGWVDDELLYHYDRFYVPQAVRMEVLRRLHDTPLAGHLGQKRTLELVQRKYYWPKMKTDIEDYCLRCTQCRKNKAETHATFGSLMPLAPAERPWSRVGIDLITDLPKTKNGHDSR